jgi:hypothetical protein
MQTSDDALPASHGLAFFNREAGRSVIRLSRTRQTLSPPAVQTATGKALPSSAALWENIIDSLHVASSQSKAVRRRQQGVALIVRNTIHG